MYGLRSNDILRIVYILSIDCVVLKITASQEEKNTCNYRLHLGVCRAPVKLCNTSTDCCWDECCVNNVQLRGKRSLFQGNSRGHCEPRGIFGSSKLS